MLRAARVLVEPAAYPRLLIVNCITIGVTIGVIVHFAGRCPWINDDEAGIVAAVTVVKRVAHPSQIHAE